MFHKNHAIDRFVKWLRLISLVLTGLGVCLFAGGAVVSYAKPDSPKNDTPQYTTRPIQSIRVGERVCAQNPEASSQPQANRNEPEWEQWLHLSLTLPKQDGSEIEIEMLRPEAWVISNLHYAIDASAGVGTSGSQHSEQSSHANRPKNSNVLRPVFDELASAIALIDESELSLLGLTVDLDLPEMGALGTAIVTNIQACPDIESGEGQPVTATFSHASSTVLDVYFEGESSPIGVTDNHLFWSDDRQTFLPIGEFETGEHVRTFRGDSKRVEHYLARPGPERVYNLEVYGEHVYFVGEQGLLAHNSCGNGLVNSFLRGGRKGGWRRNLLAGRLRNFKNNSTVFYHGTSKSGAAALRSNGISLARGHARHDFGGGFYVTTSRADALASAARNVDRADDAAVVAFRVANKNLSKLDTLRFTSSGHAWQDFVRFHKTMGPTHLMHGGRPYDMVIGPYFARFGKDGISIRALPRNAFQTSVHTQRAVDLFNRSMRR